ncbi:hypothetical protein DSCO28_46740 [Desulfosarcina ovata subsp. sediminis]|uniref:Uncharacterized protein n=1 Tax=Desulfosarcina ovata subsp. sediminis TaxID=885957 RepID=A0A5K7ZV84_9BACT|nr:hypothetical protein DSCO28_46740 [Desulfosarcina ovata subsp. sediminis]
MIRIDNIKDGYRGHRVQRPVLVTANQPGFVHDKRDRAAHKGVRVGRCPLPAKNT